MTSAKNKKVQAARARQMAAQARLSVPPRTRRTFTKPSFLKDATKLTADEKANWFKKVMLDGLNNPANHEPQDPKQLESCYPLRKGRLNVLRCQR